MPRLTAAQFQTLAFIAECPVAPDDVEALYALLTASRA